MACYFPVNAWKSQRLNESGKRGITFSLREGFQDQPLQVPCGKCDGCRASRAQMWAVRMHNEAALHERNSFLTLTYADPAPPVLDKKHLQDFFKRARHHYKFRYFGVGEYGDQTCRPHYHAIIFGEDFLAGSFKINDELYVDPKLEELWGHGHIAIAPANMSSMCYVAGYVFKRLVRRKHFHRLCHAGLVLVTSGLISFLMIYAALVALLLRARCCLFLFDIWCGMKLILKM